jgi:CubicO group peptidase (beta-lactamase class C family)
MQIFYQMLLDGCVAKGKRYLSKKAHAEFTSIQTGELECGFTPGMSFGLGPGIVREPQGVTAKLNRGTFGHGGVYGTQAWCDPKRRALYLFMMQSGGIPAEYSEEKGPENPYFVFNRSADELLAADERR